MDTALAWLADTIPVVPLGAVISIGDIAIAVGVTLFTTATMVLTRQSSRSREHRSYSDQPAP